MVGGAHHARVAIVEELAAVDAENARGVFELLRPHVSQAWASGFLVHVVDLADLATGGGDEHDAVTVGASLHHHAAGRNRLVVRVSMHQEQGAHDRSNRSASCLIPPLPGPGMVRSAAA